MSRSTYSSSSGSAFLYSDSFSSLNVQGNPLCPFNGHAFVYHAKVPCKSEQCRNREKKDNPNCFIKAFRWYTQEHNVPKDRSNDRSDLDDFAAWIDQKYDQFINDSQRTNAYESRILSSVRIAPKKPCNLFRKFRRAADCRNGGDGCEKCNPSFEVIMQAKELSRPVSECCFQNRPATYCNSSKVTVASSDTVVIKKWSKSYKKDSCENQQNELRMATPEVKIMEITEDNEKAAISFSRNTSLVEERCNQNMIETLQTNVQCQCPEEHMVKTETSTQCDTCQNQAESIKPTVFPVTETRRPSQASKFSARVKPSNEKDASPSCHPKCLYHSKEHVKIDNDTQYSDHEPTSVTAFAKCECPVNKLHSNPDTKMGSSYHQQKLQSNTKMNMASRKNNAKEMCNCTSRGREFTHNHKWVCEDKPTILVAGSAQTSDHSIVLDNEIFGFPLLVRIFNPKEERSIN